MYLCFYLETCQFLLCSFHQIVEVSRHWKGIKSKDDIVLFFNKKNINQILLIDVKFDKQISQLKIIVMQKSFIKLWQNLAPRTRKYITVGFGTSILALATSQLYLRSQIDRGRGTSTIIQQGTHVQLPQSSQQKIERTLTDQGLAVSQNQKNRQQSVTKSDNSQIKPDNKQEQRISNQKQADQSGNHEKQSIKRLLQQATKPIYLTMKQITAFPLNDSTIQIQGPFLIVADLPYNQAYQKQLLSKIDKVRKAIGQANKSLKIFKLDMQNQQNKKLLKSRYTVNLRDDLIFLLRNSYDSQLATIDYPLFTQYPNILKAYLKNLHFQSSDLKSINQMGSHDVSILFVTNKLSQNQVQYSKRLVTAKYLQLQLMVRGLENANLYIIDREDALKSQLLTQENAKANSIHIIRPKNAYTTQDPNLWLSSLENKQKKPFHVIQDIPLYDKKGNITIPYYLNQIQTFSSAMITAPFICSVTVDRNKISTQQYHQILRIFAELKKKKAFPKVNFILKFDKIPYMGTQVEQNDFWMIKVTDISSLDLQTMVHQIKSLQQLKQIGVDEKQFQRDTFQYLYKSHNLSSTKIQEFIKNSIERKQPSFYRSEKKNALQPVHKITANSFKNDIIDDPSDHLVFQYSDHCITCKTMSPLIAYLDSVYRKLPSDTKIKPPKIHSLNCDKNRIKGQLYSPYTPNLMYYKQQWKQYGPVRFPIEALNREGPMGLHNFCTITSQVGSIPWTLVELAVGKQKQRRSQESKVV